MRRLLYVGVAVLLISVLGVVFWLYFKAGLRQYIQAKQAIDRLSADKISQARSDFFAENVDGSYGGILAGVWSDRVWIWGRRGLIGLTYDEYSVYSFFLFCQPGLVADMNEGGQMFVDRVVYKSSDEWAKRMKVGGYVAATVTKDGMGVILTT